MESQQWCHQLCWWHYAPSIGKTGTAVVFQLRKKTTPGCKLDLKRGKNGMENVRISLTVLMAGLTMVID